MNNISFIIYDVRGIQKYIFKSGKIKEIVGASKIVRMLLEEQLESYAKENGYTIYFDWQNAEGLRIRDEENKIKNAIEIIYNGGGNLLVATTLKKEEIDKMNRHLQVQFLKHSYSLSLACAVHELNENESYAEARKAVKDELNDVKLRMSEVVLGEALPITRIDSITGVTLSDVNKYNEMYLGNVIKKEVFSDNKKLSVEQFLKRVKCSESDKIGSCKLDDIIDNKRKGGKDQNGKSMIAVVHIDGNDMGAMINNYSGMLSENGDFDEEIKNSRWISKVIDDVFNKKIERLFKDKYSDVARLVINSGDDITFICLAEKAIAITKEIMINIEKEFLAPKGNTNPDLEQNRFSSCAGICFVHAHFPFYKAYEIAEEVCSNAKVKAKLDRTEIKLTDKIIYSRPASYIDFEICGAGVIKSIDESREDNKHLFIRPYLVNDHFSNEIYHIDSLINYINIFKNASYIITNSKEIRKTRSNVKEIRNTYEKNPVYSTLLFERLKSRQTFEEDIIYEPFDENGVARYYDATSLIDLYEEA